MVALLRPQNVAVVSEVILGFAIHFRVGVDWSFAWRTCNNNQKSSGTKANSKTKTRRRVQGISDTYSSGRIGGTVRLIGEMRRVGSERAPHANALLERAIGFIVHKC